MDDKEAVEIQLIRNGDQVRVRELGKDGNLIKETNGFVDLDDK